MTPIETKSLRRELDKELADFYRTILGKQSRTVCTRARALAASREAGRKQLREMRAKTQSTKKPTGANKTKTSSVTSPKKSTPKSQPKKQPRKNKTHTRSESDPCKNVKSVDALVTCLNKCCTTYDRFNHKK
jgi:hypothetical protein